MSDTRELSDAKRALLAKYLRGELQEPLKTASATSLPGATAAVQKYEGVTALNTRGTKRPFFFFHGHWAGNAFFCFPLAQGLGDDQPFYALDPYPLDHLRVLPSLEEMAAGHIRVIRSIQPEGPYLLGGFCNGGLIAYEMARQLDAVGQKVDLLVLIDSIPTRLTTVCTFIHRAGQLLGLAPGKQLDWFLRLQHFYRHWRDGKSVFLKQFDQRIESPFPPLGILHKEYPAMFIWATAHYVPGFYPGKVTLLWDSAEPERSQWWQRMAEGKDQEVEVYLIPGSHSTCKTDHISGMAAQLRACLDKAQSSTTR